GPPQGPHEAHREGAGARRDARQEDQGAAEEGVGARHALRGPGRARLLRRRGAPPLVWESEEGVLERYRRAVPAEARARHTHRSYMETELGKERAKLARTRHGCPGALADWDAALNDMTLDEARGLLETIDAALRATGDRMEALGIPADGGHGRLEGSSHDALMPQQRGHGVGNPVDMDAAGFQQLQMVPFHAGNNDGLLEQFSLDDPFQTQPGCRGFQCVGGNYSGGGDAMLPPGFGNADYDWTDLTMWVADELCDAVMPLGCYPDFADGTLPPEYSAQVVTGRDYVNTPPSSGYGYPMAMGVGDNFTHLDSNYTAHWQFQRFDTNTLLLGEM
uniref:MADS-box domain-containing protein n=1 Tax=Aegilops tauschii subsp. strangulata TaxID=200361 RepID=A0A453SJ67_AEGTS